MPSLDPSGVTSKSELRHIAIRLLTKWTTDLNRDKVRHHFPRRRGLMRSISNMPFHLHPELFLQISGSTTFQFPEETCHVGPGEICLVSRGLPHRERVRPWRGPFFNIVIAYSSDHLRFHLGRQDAAGNPSIVVSSELRTIDRVHLADLLKNAADWFHEGDTAHRFAVKGSLLANLSIVLAAIEQEPADAHEPLKVMQARQLILQHLSHPQLSVNWIGRSLQGSPDYLSRLFRETMGKTLAAYITERRLIRARDLLASSSLNISQISQACGYDDPSYFTRVFRRETGLAPRHYRDHSLKHSEGSVSKKAA
jgi:AraC-like DNA-binding protein/mannose-6-phosphate isomerase-like protein (cupin superfamily)